MPKIHITPYVASLRVYEPIESFSETQITFWNNSLLHANSKISEQVNSISRMVQTKLPILTQNGTYSLEFKGRKYVCPWSLLNRSINALMELRESLPDPIFSFFVNPTTEEIYRQSETMANGKISHIINQTWNVPPRWFGLFAPDERYFGHDKFGAFTYVRTSLKNALSRGKNMHEIVLKNFGEGLIEAEINSLLVWLNNFHIGSIIELDYGGLAQFLEKVIQNENLSGLEFDTSISDLQNSLSGLAKFDGLLASKGYQKLISRWRKVSAYENAN